MQNIVYLVIGICSSLNSVESLHFCMWYFQEFQCGMGDQCCKNQPKVKEEGVRNVIFLSSNGLDSVCPSVTACFSETDVSRISKNLDVINVICWNTQHWLQRFELLKCMFMCSGQHSCYNTTVCILAYMHQYLALCSF